MKFNPDQADTYYSTIIDGVVYRYGWYKNGRAFIAMDGELMTYKEAAGKFMPKGDWNYHDRFYSMMFDRYYKKTIDGIVRYLIEKHNR